MGVRLSGFKSRLRHQKENRGLADLSVSPLLLLRVLGQRVDQYFLKVFHLVNSLPVVIGINGIITEETCDNLLLAVLRNIQQKKDARSSLYP